MIGLAEQNDKNFTPDKYEEFYEHHYFQPVPIQAAFDVHEVIPRFGWGYDKVEELKPKSLLDIGCLDGSFALTIAKHFNIPVWGVDLTQDGIDLANDRAKKAKLTATFKQGLAENYLEELIKQGISFDMVTFFEIIEHVEDVQRLLKLIDGVTKNDGHILTSTPAFESPTYGKDDEENTCHVRLYTMQDNDYWAKTKSGKDRMATSITKEIGKDRILEMEVHNELINVLYK
jgi:2-polyprenyl-3-methyl-5-hydroxy-6-metoxy-1,4-benzoquinol methylase